MAVGTDALSDVLGGGDEGRRRVLITIDDGDPTVIGNAAPIFAKHRIPYVIYVVPGFLGRRRHMSAGDLRELAATGVEIGSHTTTHRRSHRCRRANGLRNSKTPKSRSRILWGGK